MAKQQPKRGRGRPEAEKPKAILITFRVDEDTAEALASYAERLGVIGFSLSDTARQVVLRSLKSEGLL